MALQIGIVGLPNVGKSTLFNALTRANALVASYPFTTIEPNVGVAEIPDPRLDQVASIVKPKRRVPASVEFVDIAGLVKGASTGEGLGNQFLGHIRSVNAIALVLRCFEDPDIPHQFETVDPLLDLDTVNLELILADLETLARRLEKVRGAAKANPREHAHEIEFLGKLKAHLNAGQRAAQYHGNAEEMAFLAECDLLSARPQLLVANVGENELPAGGALAQRVIQRAQSDGYQAVVLCAKLEAELAEMAPADAEEFRVGLGLGDSGIVRMATAGYQLLKLITFFTATGTDEVRAWPLPAGHTAFEAAGLIHTDMQKGFIRAEVIAWDELVRLGSWAHAREIGHARIEGREYVVKDGDVVHIRFNV